MVRCFLTTFDNPYNPYEQFEQWYQDHSACCSKAGGGDAVCRYPACGGKAAETGRRSIPAWKMKGRMIFEFGSVLHFEKWKRKALGAFQGARVLLP